MRARTALSAGLAGLLVAGIAAPSIAAPPKKKPKPITGSFTAQAVPDPTNNNVRGVCEGLLNEGGNVSRFDKPFTVPARGVLHFETLNTLDWALAVLTEDGEVLGEADGDAPDVKEQTDVTFKRKTKVLLRVCNFAGEPTVTAKYKFTYK